MRRLLALLAALAFVLTGCFWNTSPRPSATPQSTEIGPFERYRQVTLPLYFLSPEGDRLVSQMREVTIENEDTRAETAVKELIKGPDGDGAGAILPAQLRLLSFEISKNVANVNFSSEFLTMLSEQKRLAARAAIASTLYDIEKVEYVNILVNNMEVGYNARPTGAISYRKYAGDLSLLYIRMQEFTPETGPDEDLPGAVKYSVPLYFADIRGQYLLPEIRTVETAEGESLRAIVNELASGPRNTSGYSTVIPDDMKLSDEPAILVNTNGKKTVTLAFTKQTAFGSANAMAMAYGALAYSIMGFVPDVETIVFRQNGAIVTELQNFAKSGDGYWRRDAFAPLLGNNVPIYLPNSDKTRLIYVQRAIAQSAVRYAKTRVWELMRGPLLNEDDEIWPVFPSGTSADDLRDVYISGDLAIVDFSQNFLDKCANMARNSESALVYSIVNTLTEISYIKRVWILIEGRAISGLGAGNIYLGNPLMRNPGIISR